MWLFDSLFVGKYLSFADYIMVDTREEELPSKKMSQKSVAIMGYSSEEDKGEDPEMKAKFDPEFLIRLEDEDEEEEAEYYIKKLKGSVALSKSKARFVICRHGNVHDPEYKWEVESKLEGVKYLTLDYLKHCIEEKQWVLPTGAKYCHLRAIPCKVPIKNTEDSSVYVSGDKVPGTKEAVLGVLKALGIASTKKNKS